MGGPFCAKTSHYVVILLCYLFFLKMIIYLIPVPVENKNAKGKETVRECVEGRECVELFRGTPRPTKTST